MATRKITELPVVSSASESDYLFGMVNGAASRIPARAARGDDGADGADGATFTPSVSPDGTLSWTNDKDLTNPEPVNIKGADGRNGADGADGRDAPQIDDDTVSISNPWSSARIVECFPAFEVRGTEVSFEAVTGSPLEVSTLLTFSQSGSGNPSTVNENVRPIASFDSLTIRHGDQEAVQPFGRPVCSGAYAWDTGLLTEDMILDVFDGSADEDIVRNTDENSTSKYMHGYNFSIELDGVADGDKRAQSRCNRMRYVTNEFKNFDFETYSINAGGTLLNIMPPEGIDTVDLFRAWLAQNPVQLAYMPAAPRVTQYGAQIFPAGSGVNTMSTTDGTLTVKGRMNPSAALAALEQRIAALENGG